MPNQTINVIIIDANPPGRPDFWRILKRAYSNCPPNEVQSDEFTYMRKVPFEQNCPNVIVDSGGGAETDAEVFEVDSNSIPSDVETE